MSALAKNVIPEWEQMLGYEYPRMRMPTESTKLPLTIEVIDNLYNDISCGPCLVAYNNINNYFDKIIISLEDVPRILLGNISLDDYESIKQFIKLNQQLLISYWNVEIGSIEFGEEYKRCY